MAKLSSSPLPATKDTMQSEPRLDLHVLPHPDEDMREFSLKQLKGMMGRPPPEFGLRYAAELLECITADRAVGPALRAKRIADAASAAALNPTRRKAKAQPPPADPDDGNRDRLLDLLGAMQASIWAVGASAGINSTQAGIAFLKDPPKDIIAGDKKPSKRKAVAVKKTQ